ncbi:hypothetical protein C7M51_02740 [Mixta intestinalis]|uniref:Uncharacterized protein n=2 Tax=Mixta intestinalis TaxID=1615494 RepID=A0A6P1Q363_9GAMM|nr:hypothetical protein C7M51_02740 [Mixta intestinalis]
MTMKKLIGLLTITTLFLLSLSAFSFAERVADDKLQKNESTQQAAELSRKMVLSDQAEKNNILNQLKNLLVKNPDNNDIRKIYINQLIAEKHYQEGLNNLEVLNQKNLTRTHLLTQCMLKERLGNRDENCYKKVIALSEQAKVIDSDYMSALFFIDKEKFENLKAKLIKENKFRESDFLVFTLGKEGMLHEFYP